MKINHLLLNVRVAKFICIAFFLFGSIINSTAQYAYIPDANFRAWLMNNGYAACMSGDSLDTTCPGVLSTTSINCGVSSISDLTGIEYFTSLTSLWCGDNQLTSVPILPSSLTEFRPFGNLLTSLSNLPAALLTLDCRGNQLTSLPALPASLGYLNVESNQLTSLPALPSSLWYLRCTNNMIASLPALPASLLTLGISDNQISTLPALPPSLESLECISNNLISLPALPTSVTTLYCANNALSSLPSPLPSSLNQLGCEDNYLTSLPALPSGLSSIYCGSNQITSLPALPSSLTYIDCKYNSLVSLPALPSGLWYLDCSFNQLSVLPALPVTLANLHCTDNLLTAIPDLPDYILVLDIVNNPVTCLPNFVFIGTLWWSGTQISCRPFIGNISNSSPFVYTLPLCQVSSGCPVGWNISGNVFEDLNGNCIQDAGEADAVNIPVALDSSGAQLQNMHTDNSGAYSFRTGLGNYSVRIDTAGLPFNVICPLAFSQSVIVSPADSLVDSLDFSLQCKNGFDLVAKSITPSVWFRPGATRTLYLHAGDNGGFYGTSCAGGVSGSVQVTLGNYLSYVSPAAGALAPSTVSANLITWNVADFGLIDPTRDFNIVVLVDPFASIFDSACATLDIFPSLGDNNPANNSLSQCFPIRNSYDPNEKYMAPSGIVNYDQEWFEFTVYFQNTGNAPAEDIYILDTLDVNFDATTFTFLSSSHESVTQMLPGNVLRFNFPDINLIDSLTDEPGSHGYVKFKVRRRDGLPYNTTLTNTAYIYFDFNPAIVTNQASATLILIIGTNETEVLQFALYPNPAKDEFTVSCLLFPVSQDIVLRVYDVLGKEILSQNLYKAHSKMNTVNWSSGIYFVELNFDGHKEIRKLVVE